MTTNPTPLEGWVIGELGLEGVIDKQEPWPRFMERVEALLRGSPPGPPIPGPPGRPSNRPGGGGCEA